MKRGIGYFWYIQHSDVTTVVRKREKVLARVSGWRRRNHVNTTNIRGQEHARRTRQRRTIELAHDEEACQGDKEGSRCNPQVLHSAHVEHPSKFRDTGG